MKLTAHWAKIIAFLAIVIAGILSSWYVFFILLIPVFLMGAYWKPTDKDESNWPPDGFAF